MKNEKNTNLDIYHEDNFIAKNEEIIETLKKKILNKNLSLKDLSFYTDSLSMSYLKNGYIDSAVSVSIFSLDRDSSLENLKNTSKVFFLCYERSQDLDIKEQCRVLASKNYQKILDKEPDNLIIKTNFAVTLVGSQNPMSGISLLRDIVSKNPNFREAHLNLGILSIRSGQFEKAKERFEILLNQDKNDAEAMLYLAICLKELENNIKSKKLLENIVNMNDIDPVIKITASEYLKELN